MFFSKQAVFLLHKNPACFCIPLVAKEILKTMESVKRNSGGRPKKVIKRESATGIRFTQAEYFIIKQKMIRRPPRSTLFPYDVSDLGGRRIIRSESTRLNSSHTLISYAVFCLKNKT